MRGIQSLDRQQLYGHAANAVHSHARLCTVLATCFLLCSSASGKKARGEVESACAARRTRPRILMSGMLHQRKGQLSVPTVTGFPSAASGPVNSTTWERGLVKEDISWREVVRVCTILFWVTCQGSLMPDN